MAGISIVMPNDKRYRISSMKRYLVVNWLPDENRWKAAYRTQVHSLALARWRRELRAGAQTTIIDREADGGPAVIR